MNDDMMLVYWKHGMVEDLKCCVCAYIILFRVIFLDDCIVDICMRGICCIDIGCVYLQRIIVIFAINTAYYNIYIYIYIYMQCQLAMMFDIHNNNNNNNQHT